MKIRDQISVKSPVGFTKKAQPCDLARGHHDFDKVYKGSKFASANIQKILASHQTSNMLRNACAAVRNLKFPKASTDVLLRVILLSDKIDSCFTAEKIRKGFELAHYPNVDVRKILEQNLAFNGLVPDDKEKIVELVLGEFTQSYTKDRELSDQTIVTAFEREGIYVAAKCLTPLKNEENMQVSHIRACEFASDSFREAHCIRKQGTNLLPVTNPLYPGTLTLVLLP